MVNRLKIALPQTEFDALFKLSLLEVRNPADQVRVILRAELERRGMLPTSTPQPQGEPQRREALTHESK
jgi:hypothetical protein